MVTLVPAPEGRPHQSPSPSSVAAYHGTLSRFRPGFKSQLGRCPSAPALPSPFVAIAMQQDSPPNGAWARVPAGEEGATILAVLPWLGVPVLVSAALAKAGHPMPGEVLPVAAF